MQKFTVKNDGAKLNGPVELRLFDIAVLEANKAVLGSRWPKNGMFTLPEGATVDLRPGDVVQIDDSAALMDVATNADRRAGVDVPVKSAKARKG